MAQITAKLDKAAKAGLSDVEVCRGEIDAVVQGVIAAAGEAGLKVSKESLGDYRLGLPPWKRHPPGSIGAALPPEPRDRP